MDLRSRAPGQGEGFGPLSNPDFRGAFTLIELLVVIGIMLLLAAVSIPAFQSISPAQKLATAGSRVSGLIDAARMNAMTRQLPTALVVITNLSTVADANLRTFTALEYGSNGTTNVWSNISKWEVLPAGLVLNNAGSNTALQPAASNSSLPNSTRALRYKGVVLPNSSYGYLLFNPNGSLETSTNAKMEFVVGTASGGNVTRTGPTNNWYRLIINNATGRTKAVRP